MATARLPRPEPPLARRRDLQLASAHVEVIAHQLTKWLNQLLEDGNTFLIVSREEQNRYVQFITDDGDYLRAEVSGNVFIHPDHQLTDAELLDLARLGWEPPEADEVYIGNHWRMWVPPDVADAAQMGALALCRIVGVTDATLAEVEVTAGEQ